MKPTYLNGVLQGATTMASAIAFAIGVSVADVGIAVFAGVAMVSWLAVVIMIAVDDGRRKG